MTEGLTICVQCRFFRQLRPVWYSQFCEASPLEPAIHPVTGSKCYKTVNDKGRVCYTDDPYAYARDINTDGHCPLYQKKDQQ